MSRSKSLILTFTLWISLTMCPQVECGQNSKQEAGVTIELTKLDVNDTTLDLNYKIKNRSDHNIWLCDSANVYGVSDFEVFMAKDAQTLVIRKRFDLPIVGIVERIPTSRYVCLRSGEDLIYSLSLDVPVRHSTLFKREEANAKYASRLALEISFYNEDLPGLILHILEVGEKLGCTHHYGMIDSNDLEIRDRYFGGLVIQGLLKNRPDFSESIIEGGEQVIIPYNRQVLKGEQVLRFEVDSVSIPYDSAPAAEEPANDEVEDTPITLALTKLDVNDTNLDLSWNIKNNTDHDVWVCASLSPEYPSVYEYFLDKDGKILVLRRRSDMPIKIEWAMHYPPLRARYIRLCSGQEKAESASLTVPVRPYRISEGESGNAECAKRLVLEIGFYNEDLPGLILQIVELAEKLNCDLDVGLQDFREIRERFFGGRMIAQAFKHLLGFSESVMSAWVDGEFTIHYMGPSLNGEQSLSITIDGVSIPYKSSSPPLTGNTGKRPETSKDIRRAAHKKASLIF